MIGAPSRSGRYPTFMSLLATTFLTVSSSSLTVVRWSVFQGLARAVTRQVMLDRANCAHAFCRAYRGLGPEPPKVVSIAMAMFLRGARRQR
jgi:hypothetical protein